MDANLGGTGGGRGARLLSVVGKVLAVTAIAAVVGLKAWGYAGPQTSRAAQQEKLKNFERVTGEIKVDALQEMEREGVLSEGTRQAAIQKLDQHLAKESDAGGDVGAMMRAQRRWLAMMNKETSRIDAVQNSLAEAPGFGDCTFENLQQVERAIELAKAAEAECLRVERLARRSPDVLKALLEEEGMSKAAARGFMSGAANGLSMSVKVRECETSVVRCARGQLEILRDQWGSWGLDENGRLAFDDDVALKKYLALTQEMKDSSAESMRLSKELMKGRQQR